MGIIGSIAKGVAGIGGPLLGGLLGSNAAKNAANVQAQGAQQAQQLEKNNQQQGIDFQNQVWSGDQSREQPYLNVGATSANHLADFLQTPFSAPSLADVQNSPGYQFQLGQGIDALDKSAAARGNLFSGTQGTELEKYGQGLADTTYTDAYNRALNTYTTNFNTLMGGAQLGQSSAGTLGAEGQGAANNMTNLDLVGGSQQAQQINNAAAARASGYIGSANAWIPAIQNSLNFASNPKNFSSGGDE